MKYRVYIKQARKNLLDTYNIQINQGNIDQYTGEMDDTLPKSYIITSPIPIDQNKKYQLMDLGYRSYHFYTFEYESKTSTHAINNSRQEFEITDNDYFQYYTPKTPNAKFVRLKIFTDLNANTPQEANLLASRIRNLMFLESENAVLIHDSQSPEITDHLLNPNLNMADSTSGSFEFVIYKDHHYYNTGINLWTDTIYITRTYKNGSERVIWDGRPISKQQDSSGNISVYCEGALGYFNDLRVIKNTGYEFNLNVQDFVMQYILDYQNDNSRLNNRMDRTFYGNKNGTVYEPAKCIDVDAGYKNLWKTQYESGLKWINDIKEAYSGHVKIVYPKTASPNDDILFRKLVIIQDFDKKNRIYHYAELDPGSKKKGRLEKGYIYYNDVGRQKDRVQLFLVTTSFYYSGYNQLVPGVPGADFVGYDYVKKADVQFTRNLSTEIKMSVEFKDPRDTSGRIYSIKDIIFAPTSMYNYTDQNGNEIQGIEDLKVKVPILCFKPTGYEKIARAHVSFGIDIFDGAMSSEVGDIATKIIPRGMECNDTSGESTNIFMTTDYAFVDGNYSSGGIQGRREFTPGNGKPEWLQQDSIIDQKLTKIYGLVEAVIDFESAETPAALWNMGNKWLRDLRSEVIRTSIETSLSDFGQIEMEGASYESMYTDDEYIDIWTRVYAKIPELGIGTDDPEESFYVVGMNIPLDDHLNTKITLANNSKMISDSIISAGDIKGTSKGIIDKSNT